jgi:hypothetical protein
MTEIEIKADSEPITIKLPNGDSVELVFKPAETETTEETEE